MKRCFILYALLLFQSLEARASWPFAPPAGQPGSTAIHLSDNAIVSWADGYEDVQYGSFIQPSWKTPAKALGPAQGTSVDVVCLGRGGRITMTFAQGIADEPGFDFAVFENAFDDYFLELGWVEVSSDGSHFVRFPNYSWSVASSSTFYARDIDGLAGKYRQEYGTPFDLSELQSTADFIATNSKSFTSAYVSAFNNNFPFLDRSNVKYVRIIDIVGDGSARDAEGFVIYDPYPTSGSAGFDLDAIAVLHQPPPNGLAQATAFDPIPNQKLAFQSLELSALSDSGLPVFFTLQSGPATLFGNTLTFTGTGVVEVVARQGGDATYAPAAPVLRSFQVADELQHIFFEAVPNQIKGNGSIQLNAYASSGLPVSVEVISGPDDAQVQTNRVLNLGVNAGTVGLRAFQPGDASYAPAEDIFMDFQIVEPGTSNAPLTLAQWATFHSVPTNGLSDSDGDGAIDFQEFIMGGDPNSPSNTPLPILGSSLDAYGRPSVILDYPIDRSALGRCRISQSTDLSSWTNAVPEILEQNGVGSIRYMKVGFPAETNTHFYRLIFERQ